MRRGSMTGIHDGQVTSADWWNLSYRL